MMRTNESRNGGSRAGWMTFAIILSVSAVLAYLYFRQVGSPRLAERIELHEQIMRGTADAPYRYRVLVPFLGEGITRMLDAALPGDRAFLFAYALYDLAAILFLLGSLHRYLRAWFSNEQALVGVLFAAAAMPMALRDHYFQPWSILEAGLFTAGLICIRGGRHRLLALVVALASLNRETGIFIPLAFLIAAPRANGGDDPRRPSRKKAALLLAGYTAIWAAAFFGLRLVLGEAPSVETVGGLLAKNTIGPALLRTAVHVALLFGAFWIFAAAGFRRAPAFVKRTALLVPPYLVVVILWGIWYEVRLLLPLNAIVIPLGLSFLYRERGAVSPPEP